MKACQYINVKTGRAGGLQNCLDINAICRQAGMGCWVGGMMESDLGKAICVELAAVPGMNYAHDVTPAMFNYPDSITEKELILDENCCLPVSDKPGTPVLPDMKKLLPKVAAKAVIEA